MAAGLAASFPVAAANDVPWLKYHPAIGCPSRDVLVDELLRRMSYRIPQSDKSLLANIEYADASYVGSVSLDGSDSTVARQVQNESCDQVVHALALMGALLLEEEQQPASAPAPLPTNLESQTATKRQTEIVEQTIVTTPTLTNPSAQRIEQKQIRSLTIGPWFGLSSDGLVTPDLVRLGGRGGMLLTFHQLVPGTQQMLRLSVARVQSGTIAKSAGREASIRWTSVRLDACHGWKAHQLPMIGGCALLDLGDFSGAGSVNNDHYEKGTLLARAGGMLYVRLPIVAGLSVHADLGAALPFAQPSFVFEPNSGLPMESVHRVRQIGPVADLGLEMHFW